MEIDPQKALKALEEINKIVSQFQDSFPVPFKLPIKKKTNEPANPMKILKQVNGIIKNFNETNSTRKLSSLIRFFDSIRKNIKKPEAE